jgi:large subunit ribosomal protein L21
MIAVIETGGKQYIVKKGDVFTVDRLDETLDKHTFTPLLIADEEGGTKIGAPLVEGAVVYCTVREHVRDDKVRVFKMKSKKHYHRTQGFRACQTKLEVTSISA